MNELSIHRIVSAEIVRYKRNTNQLGTYYSLGIVFKDDKGNRTEISVFSKDEYVDDGEEEPFDLKFGFPEVEVDNELIKFSKK